MRTTQLWILGAVALCVALPEGAAIAQDNDGGPKTIDQIIVTARKREENLQDTPLAVTALTADALEDLGVEDTSDISNLAPNVYLTQTPGSAANIGTAIRGVSNAEPLQTVEAGVALYIDDAYLARASGAVLDLVDLERVEVLRGPQGTLYGRNATGGAIKFISAKPSEERSLKQKFTIGTFGEFSSRTSVNVGEIGSGTNLYGRGTFLYKERDGYVNNRNASDGEDPGAYETTAFRLALRWEPTEDLTVDYSYDYVDTEGYDALFQLFAVSPGLAASFAGAGTPLAPTTDRRESVNLDFQQASEHKTQGHNLTFEWDLGFATLTSISTYRDWENTENATELDGSAGLNVFGLNPMFAPGLLTNVQLFAASNEREQDQFTQELRLQGDLFESVQWTVGAYYFEEEFEELNPQQFIVPAGGMLPLPLQQFGGLFYSGEAESWALFASATWTPDCFDQRLSFTGGVRYSDDQKEFVQTISNPMDPAFPRRGNDADFNSFDWDFAVNFAATEDINVYGRVATAYKAGGFNPRASSTLEPFDEEELTSYEIGVKALLLDGRLRVNAAYFYSEYEDIQVNQFASGAGGASSVTVNAGEATIQGIEVETLWLITDNLTFQGSWGLLDPEYDEFLARNPVTNAVVDIADKASFGYQPNQTALLALHYESDPLGADGLVVSARLEWRYTGGPIRWTAIEEVQGVQLAPFLDEIQQDSYDVVNARIALSDIPVPFGGGSAEIGVFGRNIFDEEYVTAGIDFGGLGFGGAAFAPPATFGVDVTFNF